MIEPVPARVTAVVPTRNRLALLRTTLATILDQRDVDMYAVVVDDASTDGTPAWLDALDDPRVRVVHHETVQGPSVARNTGIAEVTTPWTALCDDDDLWSPEKVSAQLAAIAETPGARWATTGTVSIGTDLQIIGHQRPPASGDVFGLLEAHNVVPAGASSVLVDTELLREVGGFDATFKSCEDYECWMRLAARAPLACADRPLVGYRVAGQNRSNNVAEMRAMHDAVLARHRRSVDATDAHEGDLVYAQHLARFPLRQGKRLEAARAYLAIAWRWKLPTHVVHALLALIVPGLAERRRATAERAEVPAAWAADAEVWLAPLRRGELATVGRP